MSTNVKNLNLSPLGFLGDPDRAGIFFSQRAREVFWVLPDDCNEERTAIIIVSTDPNRRLMVTNPAKAPMLPGAWLEFDRIIVRNTKPGDAPSNLVGALVQDRRFFTLNCFAPDDRMSVDCIGLPMTRAWDDPQAETVWHSTDWSIEVSLFGVPLQLFPLNYPRLFGRPV